MIGKQLLCISERTFRNLTALCSEPFLSLQSLKEAQLKHPYLASDSGRPSVPCDRERNRDAHLSQLTDILLLKCTFLCRCMCA